MFPSAANISSAERPKNAVSDLGSWLQSSSYRPSASTVPSLGKVKCKKKRKLSESQKTQHSPISSPQEGRPFNAIDLYSIDTSSNRNIYKYGSIYEGDVAKFRQNECVPIIGSRGTLRLLDLNPEAVKEEIKRNRRKRYFSKKNRIRLAVPGAPIETAKEDAIDVPKPYISLQWGSPASLSEDPKSERTPSLQRIADLNRTVYETPGSVRTWLELVEVQLLNNDVEQDQGPSDRHRLVLLERQIAIVERAIAANSGNLRLRILLTALREYTTELIASGVRPSSSSALESLQYKDQVAREWSQLVFTCPQFVCVWRGYLAHLRGRFGLFSVSVDTGPTSAFGRIDAVYRRALTTLSGIVSGRILSHKPSEDTADQTVDLLAEYCQWLAQTGFTERAFSIWQAVVEFVCYCPSRLQSKHGTTLSERQREFERFWTSENTRPLFGVPGARGWARWYSGEEKTDVPKGASTTTNNTPIAEIDEEWGSVSPSSTARWGQITREWNAVSETAEDALLNFNNSHGDNTESSDGAANLSFKGYQSGDGSLTNRLSRGLAWLGLERARESAGWLPAGATLLDTSMTEDADRQPRFEDIEPCLLEVHLDQTVSDQAVLDRRRQRLVLLFLEFLGIWDADVAVEYKLPADLQQVHELSSVSCLQRQGINPRQFGFPWLRSSLEAGSASSNVSSRMRVVLAGSSLEQASRLFVGDCTWQSTIGRLKFCHLASSIERALVTKQITPKAALGLWRKKARNLLSASNHAQSDLSLWLAYAKGLVRTACATPDDSSLLFTEARKVFTSTLRMYPVPAHSSASTETTLEHQLNLLLPRLQILHAFLEFELGVNFPIDLVRASCCQGRFSRALHLVRHAAAGGAFVPLADDEHQTIQRESLAEIGNQLAQRLETLRSSVAFRAHSRLTQHSIANLAGILSSLLLHLQLLTLDENKMKPVCEVIFPVLRDVDGAFASSAKCSWWSSDKTCVPAGCASRRFIRLALPSITSVSLLCQRNRSSMTEAFIALLGEFYAVDEMPLFTSPFEWTHLLPFKVAANCGAHVSRTCSIEYQRSLQGLLPPLVLSSLESRFSECVRGVCQRVANHLTATCHRTTMGRRKQLEEVDELDNDPSCLLGLASSQQSELLARVLPSCSDLLCVGLELEHWTSLVAGASDTNTSDPLSHCWIQSAVPRIRCAFEKALSASAMNPLVRFGSGMPSLVLTMSPSVWADHLRIVLWSAYMAFEWTVAGGAASSLEPGNSSLIGDFNAHRKQRTAFKAIFYRAVEDLPWAKILYTDLARYCPEDAEEVVDLLTSRELRLRTPMEEVDLLLTSRQP
ncbi:unnamed protein product [Mesocestoides corti]|nr:unnamed protein product [Mesocestoides corti]